jgi:multidrug efflux pump subunit AcrA (membrane-fusion protein)
LADETDPVPGDRRQPPQPEVVVMPPMAAPPAPSPRRGRAAFLALLVVGGGIGAAVWFLRPSEAPPVPRSSSEAAPRVHVVSPQPTTFYLWFDEIGSIAPPREDTLAFQVGGRVLDAMIPGATFVAGDAIARLQGVAARELAVNRLRSRVAFFEQLRDSSRAEGAEAAAGQADIKLAARKLELAAAQAALAELEIRPKVPGEIAQVLVQKGDLVKGGAAAFHVRSTWPRATFALSAEDAARLQELGFCRIETVPANGAGGDHGTEESKVRTIDCVASTPTAASGVASDPRVAVDLIGATGVTTGTRVRLASARYDGVFPVPQSCVLREGDVDHVWVVSGGGRFAERRTVERVATVDTTELVAHGIAVGDAVVVDPPATLRAGSEIDVVR